MTRIELDGGKYTVCHENGTNLRALRNGEPWRELTGDGLVLAMAQRIEELEAAIVPKCCVPTPEEEALLASGDYRPEELWGGSRPTCPNCIGTGDS